jgi:DHA1 family bicyclomycin/chloramphenicol resistance-like MFS transporter
VLTNRVALCYTLASTLVFGAPVRLHQLRPADLCRHLRAGRLVPGAVRGRRRHDGVSSFANSRLVGRFGMRRLSHGALIGFLAVNVVTFSLVAAGPMPLWAFATLFTLAMLQFGWIGSNFNAIAMEPLGHIAGTASASRASSRRSAAASSARRSARPSTARWCPSPPASACWRWAGSCSC